MVSHIDSHMKIGLVKWKFFPNFMHNIQCQQQEWGYPTVQMSCMLRVATGGHQPRHSTTGREQGSESGRVKVMSLIQGVRLGGNSRRLLRNNVTA